MAAEPKEKCLAGENKETKTGRPLLRGSYSVEAAQELGEIVARGGDLMAFVEVLQSPQGRAPHPAGIEHMGKATFDVRAVFAQECSTILAAH